MIPTVARIGISTLQSQRGSRHLPTYTPSVAFFSCCNSPFPAVRDKYLVKCPWIVKPPSILLRPTRLFRNSSYRGIWQPHPKYLTATQRSIRVNLLRWPRATDPRYVINPLLTDPLFPIPKDGRSGRQSLEPQPLIHQVSVSNNYVEEITITVAYSAVAIPYSSGLCFQR